MNQPPYGQPPHQPQGGPGQPYGGGPGAPPPGGWVPPPGGSNKTLIIAVIAGAVVLVGVLVTLWLTGVFGGSSSKTTTYPRPAPTAPMTTPATPATPSPSTTGTLTREYLVGRWGPVCPGSQAGSLEFRADGTIVSAQGVANWTLSGNTVTTMGGGVTESSTWTPQGPDAASVVVPNIGTATLRRCPATQPGI